MIDRSSLTLSCLVKYYLHPFLYDAQTKNVRLINTAVCLKCQVYANGGSGTVNYI
jgi:hypothetical protein